MSVKTQIFSSQGSPFTLALAPCSISTLTYLILFGEKNHGKIFLI